ncbi:MAG: glycine-rich domain-containing protein [Candidatus Kapaibacteriota bacterium]
MIEKCSIGNMSYNIQNITLIILILILIIVIIYYLRNSSTKHNELIEKYTTPTDIKSDESYNTHNSLDNSQRNSEFPTSGTEITLRPCQVQFNDKFDGYPNDTVRYVYEDGWQEIATLKEPGLNSTVINIPEKIISRSNETNQDAITNYSERSKCFRKMSDTDNKYRYAGNALINYRTGNNLTKGTHSQLNADGALENYMEMKFNLDPLKTSDYYNNLKTSICSLRYSNTLGGTSLGDKVLYRLTLNARNQITAINQITINSTNNHIFTVNLTTDLAALLTSSDRDISYQYNGSNFVYKDKLNNTGTQDNGKNNIDVEIYTFNRELLCNRENEEKVKYQTIKSYKIIDNNKIDVNTILKATSGDVEEIIENTNFPGTATDKSYTSKDSLLTAINERIKSERDTANASVNTDIERYNRDITTTEGERNVFLTSINTKATFFDKIFDANTVEIRKTFLVSESGLISNLELNKLGYTTQDVSAYETILTTTQEPSFSKIVNNNEEDIYTIETYTDTSSPYTITFDKATICSILIVGGGGGGAGFNGGGGAGAVLYSSTIELPANTYTIKVGKGGDGTSAWKDDTTGGNGGNSSISSSGITYEAIGGGGGGQRRDGYNRYLGRKGEDGGSGGGGSHSDISTPNNYGGLSNKNTYTGWTSLGNPGGEGKDGLVPTGYGGGGGGGAGGVGANAGTNEGGSGGVGVNLSSIFGTKVGDNGWFGGGGGGGSWTGTAGKGGSGGKGGGGNAHGGNGIANTGGGGGGGGDGAPSGNGGSGIVIIKYKNVPEQDGDEKKITLTFDKNQYNSLVYDFSRYNDLTSWKNYAKSIGAKNNFTDGFYYVYDGVFVATRTVGYIELTLPSTYNTITVSFTNGWNNENDKENLVNLKINNDIKATAKSSQTIQYTQTYSTGDILIIEEIHSFIKNLKITLENRIVNYTTTLPIQTTININ